jgi:branched-chain amino acid transport system ATP-binding protein
LSTEPLLRVEGVSKSFGALAAVNDVSFEVGAGEVLGIAGPNGAGKTTLFNLISGIPFAADSGRVTFDGARIEALAPHRIFKLGLARTFQKEAAFPNLTVAQNVRVAATFGGRVSGAARPRAVDNALTLFDLAGERDRPAASLTVYATKRLMLASAVVNQPKLLMLDEPVSGLNAAERSDVQRLILRLRDEGMAIILVEHVLPLLFGVSQRVMVMDFGRKLVEGPPTEIARDQQVIEAYLGGQGKVAIDALPG